MSEGDSIFDTRLATWSTGHTLTRVLTHHDFVWPKRSQFELRAPHGLVLFTIQTEPMDRLGHETLDEVHILIPEGNHPYTDHRLHQALLVSAIVEVLGLRIQPNLITGPLLAPVLMFRKDLEKALGRNEDMEHLARQLEQVDEENKTEARKKYLAETSEQLVSVPRFHAMKRWRQHPSTLRSWVPASTITYIDEGIEATHWRLHLLLQLDPDFEPGVVCRVMWSDDSSRQLLGESRRSMLDALLDAGLIWPVETRAESVHRDPRTKALAGWADHVLESAPEVTERFDIESYRLLGQQAPYLWDAIPFTEWVKVMKGEVSP